MSIDDMAARRAIAAQVADYLGNPGPKDPRYRALLARAITAGRFDPPTPTAAPLRTDAPTPKRRKPRDPRAPRRPRYVTPDGVKRPKPGSPMRTRRGIVGMVK